jgi:hypothetical protein
VIADRRAEHHAEIDRMAEEAHAEGRRMAQAALDSINVKVGWWIRSDAQRRRWEKAKKEGLTK